MRFSTDTLVSPAPTTIPAPAPADEPADRLIPQASAWLRGLAHNPAVPAPLRRRVRELSAKSVEFPTRAVTVADLRAAVAGTADADRRRALLLTSELPADLDAALSRGAAPELRFATAADERTRLQVLRWLRGELRPRPPRFDDAGRELRTADDAEDDYIPERWNRKAGPAWTVSRSQLAVVQAMYAQWGDPLWSRIPEHPWFVDVKGLARFVGHELPYVRLTALEDPLVTAAEVAALLTDASPTLRWWARRDRRLP
ncbi:hypothetical protein, partial [Yinghuangia soli]